MKKNDVTLDTVYTRTRMFTKRWKKKKARLWND